MESKIIFVGTKKSLKEPQGIVLITEGFQFIIDPGPGFLSKSKALGININSTTSILVSHKHLMHCNDVNPLLMHITHNGLDRRSVLISNEDFINSGLINNNLPERILTPKEGQTIGIENIEIQALKTNHEGIGFKFITPEFSLIYSSDTGYSEDVAEQYKNVDFLILNVPYLEKESDSNLNKESAIKIISKCRPRLVLLSHFGSRILREDPITLSRDVQKATGVQTMAARDGFVLTPSSSKRVKINHTPEEDPELEKVKRDNTSLSYL